MRTSVLAAALAALSPALASPWALKRDFPTTCTVSADCMNSLRYCTSDGICQNFQDCRGTSKPCFDGNCVNSDPNADRKDPNIKFACVFPNRSSESAAPSSVAPSAAESSAPASSSAASSADASSVASAQSSATSSATSAAPSSTDGKICTSKSDCAATQFCNGYGHGINACLTYRDCRGTIDSCPGGACINPNPSAAWADWICDFTAQSSAAVSSAMSTLVSSMSSAASVASSSFSAVPSSIPSNDCRTTPCVAGDYCTLFKNGTAEAFECFNNATLPTGPDCRMGGCPGGICGYNGNGFQCFFNVSITSILPSGSASMSASVHSSAMSSATSIMPSVPKSAEPGPTAVPAQTGMPAHSAASSEYHRPAPSSGGVIGAPIVNSGHSSASPLSSTDQNGLGSQPGHLAPGSTSHSGSSTGSSDVQPASVAPHTNCPASMPQGNAELWAILKQIKDDLDTIKADVYAIKCKIEA